MKGNEFIKRIRKYGKQHNMYVQWMAERGKGSHGTLYLGDHHTIVRNPKEELKTGTLRYAQATWLEKRRYLTEVEHEPIYLSCNLDTR